MFFLSDSERRHLRELLLKKAKEHGLPVTGLAPCEGLTPCQGLDDRHIESDAHLMFEGLHMLADGHAARLYAMLHPHGRHSHHEANGGRTMLMMQKIEEYGSAGCGTGPEDGGPADGIRLRSAGGNP
ncbi:MAG: hypothetical protein M0003_10650 [Acidithiobacillus sp.]|jgi:hypothetical protein|nr:hypothetical protein [Acidithiobacillus sp.]